MTTAPIVLDGADLVELCTLLKAGPIKSASTDPSKVQPLPGVWVRVDSINAGTLASGCDIATTLHLIIGDRGWDSAWDKLGERLGDVLAVINEIGGPSGPIVPVGVVLPVSATPMPALAVPFILHTQPEETP